MRHSCSLLLKLVVLLLLQGVGLSTAHAAPAILKDGILKIPRVDVDTLGAMSPQFQFEKAVTGEVYLVLIKLDPAASGESVSALYNGKSGTLEVFDLQATDGTHFFAVFKYAPLGNVVRFKLTEALSLSAITTGSSNTQTTTGTSSGLGDHSAQKIEYDKKCGGCHGEQGLGTAIGPTIIACATCNSLSVLESYIDKNMPLGQPGSCDALCAKEMANYIIALNAAKKVNPEKTVNELSLMNTSQALRKASMQLVNRLPTETEIALTQANGEAGLATALSLMMTEPAFYERIGEFFNFYLLTDKYLSKNESEGAVRLLNKTDFPNYRWFDDGAKDKTEAYYKTRDITNDALAREPLELIKYVVKNNRPMSEILTANYVMVNSYSARSYGISGLQFANPNDTTEFVEGKITGIPHAGILTSPMFLNRYPTTYTNRNRGRARVVFDYFLDTDILAIDGARPGNAVDLVNPVPTIDNPDCSKCHGVLDPVASTFQNFDERGSFRPTRLSRNGWFPDMEARGFAGKLMPLGGYIDNSLGWLAKEIAVDPRFPRAMVRIMVRGLTGKEPLRAPGEGASTSETTAYLAERAQLNQIEQRFVADNMNLKTLVREIILSPYWQAAGLIDPGASVQHSTTGSVSLLGPEKLNAKLKAMVGFEWRGTLDSYHKNVKNEWEARLLNKNYFQQIYGGTDSDSVAKPLTSPNGLMGAVQARLANEMACYAVPNEFYYQQVGRTDMVRLFPFVTQTTSPYNADGKVNQANVNLIKQNIRFLHGYLLGEELAEDDPELRVTERLFIDVLDYGRASIAKSTKKWEWTGLPWACGRRVDMTTGTEYKNAAGQAIKLEQDPNYLIRSWMAVVAYLMADYRFVYE